MFIEQIMIFALGFLCAGLLTLLFLPAFWRRAMTLSKRRLEMQMPLSMAEIVAERDQLRAEFAAEQRRLEQRLESVEAGRASDKVELGQRLMRGVALESDLTALRRDYAETSKTLETAVRSISAAEAELSTAAKQLYDVDSTLERRNAAFADLSRVHGALGIQSDEQRMSIAGLETQLSGREVEIEALQRDMAGLRIEVSEVQSALDLVTIERDHFRSDARNAQARRETLQLEFEAQARRIEDMQGGMRGLEREKTRLVSEAAESARLLDGERQRLRDLSARNAAHSDAIKTLENRAAQEADLARAGKAAVEGALGAQRRETENARAEIMSLREELRQANARLTALQAGVAAAPASNVTPITAAADAGKTEFPVLRKAIADIGQDIARVAAELEKSKQAESSKKSIMPAKAHTSAAE